MTTLTSSSQRYRLARAYALALGIAMTPTLVTTAVAQASSRPALSAGAICGKVSSAAISAVVGYSVPAVTPGTIDLKATPKNDEIASAETSCTYGGDTLAALPKTIILVDDVTSKPLTPAELKKGLAQAQKLKMTFVPYRSLGSSAYYYTMTISGAIIRGMTVLKGVDDYGAAVYTKAMSTSKLAALARLAEKL